MWEEAVQEEWEALKLSLHLFSLSSSHVLYDDEVTGSTKMCQETQNLEGDCTTLAENTFE